jgi:hypothetical protein
MGAEMSKIPAAAVKSAHGWSGLGHFSMVVRPFLDAM